MAKIKFDLNESTKPVSNQENKEEKMIVKKEDEAIKNTHLKPKRVVPNANDERRDAITQIRFQPSVKDMAVKKATSDGVSLAEYLHRLIIEDNK